MMQIKLATARGLGYTGDAAGLRDPNTNLTYAVKYLAGAYHAANGDHDRAVRLFRGRLLLRRKAAASDRPSSRRASSLSSSRTAIRSRMFGSPANRKLAQARPQCAGAGTGVSSRNCVDHPAHYLN